MEWFNLIAELGVPIAGALVMAYFIFQIPHTIVDPSYQSAAVIPVE